jgi:hypothetical protein
LLAGCADPVDLPQLALGRLCWLSLTRHTRVCGRVLSCMSPLCLHVCGLCAALLMAPQGTHLSVLNRAPGCWRRGVTGLQCMWVAGVVCRCVVLLCQCVCALCAPCLCLLPPCRFNLLECAMAAFTRSAVIYSGLCPCLVRGAAHGACSVCSLPWVPVITCCALSGAKVVLALFTQAKCPHV